VRFRFMLALKLTVVAVTLLLTFTAQKSRAQDIFGTINGTVTDSSGAAVPNAQVTITDEQTKVSRPVITANDQGFYNAASLPVGIYTVSASQKGFKVTTVTGNNLVAGGHLTVDLTLQVGEVSEVVQVNGAAVVALQKTSGDIERTVGATELATMPLNERNYVQLISLLPGSAVQQGNFDQTAFTTGQSIAPAVIDGLRTDSNLFTVDGGFNLDSGSNGTQFNNVGIDFTQEVVIETSNYSSEYGRSAGATINVVTKSGGDSYHGSAFEYFRNNVFDALNALQNSTGDLPHGGFGGKPATEVPVVRFNDFGGDIGGPIKKGKVFFFTGIEFKRLIIPGDGIRNLTVPTTAELAGNFLDQASKSTLAAKGTVSPTCIGSYSGASNGNAATDTNPADFVVSSGATLGTGTAINPTCITGAGHAIANVYNLLDTPGANPFSAATFTNTAATQNATFDPSTPQNWEEDIQRVDWYPTTNHAMYFRGLHDHLVLVDPFGIFAPGGNQLPTSPSLRNRPGYDYQIADVWTPSSHFSNEAKFTIAWNKQRIPVTGSLWMESTYGFTKTNYVEPYGQVGPYPNGIPNLTFNGGTCNSLNGCTAQVYGPYNDLLAPTVDISPQDNITYTWRSHTIRFGVMYARNRKDQNSRQNSPNGNGGFSSANPNFSGIQFADALLGNYNSYTQLSGDPIGHYRFNDYGTYLADTWKFSPRLTFDIGTRLDYTVPTYVQANNLAAFDPLAYVPGEIIVNNDKTNLPFSATGGVLGGTNLDCPGPPINAAAQAQGPCASGGFVVDGVVRSGTVPADQAVRVPTGNSAFVTTVPTTNERGFFRPEAVWSPRVGVAWSPFGDKTVFRAGWGVYYDKPEGNIVFGQTGVVPFVQSVTYTAGNLGALPASGATPTIGGFSGINPNLRVARVQQYSVSVQRQLPLGLFLQAAYVGDHGWDELRDPDINVPTFAAAAASAGGGTAFINSIRPYLGYTSIQTQESDAYSNYNSLQISASRTRGDLTFQVSYTYASALATDSGEGDNTYPLCSYTCVNSTGQTIPWQQYWYGPQTYDVKNVFVSSFSLNEPFFKHMGGVPGGFLAHWTLAGQVEAQSGQPLTPQGGFALGSLQGGQTFNNRGFLVSGQSLGTGVVSAGGSNGSTICPATKVCDFNPAYFSTAGLTTAIGSAPIGNIIGPGYYAWDLTLRKSFPIRESMNLMLEADAFNAFNRVNYSNPNTSLTSGSFGQITGANPPRQLQFVAKVTF
jgi:hypothetical protein